MKVIYSGLTSSCNTIKQRGVVAYSSLSTYHWTYVDVTHCHILQDVVPQMTDRVDIPHHPLFLPASRHTIPYAAILADQRRCIQCGQTHKLTCLATWMDSKNVCHTQCWCSGQYSSNAIPILNSLRQPWASFAVLCIHYFIIHESLIYYYINNCINDIVLVFSYIYRYSTNLQMKNTL